VVWLRLAHFERHNEPGHCNLQAGPAPEWAVLTLEGTDSTGGLETVSRLQGSLFSDQALGFVDVGGALCGLSRSVLA